MPVVLLNQDRKFNDYNQFELQKNQEHAFPYNEPI